MKNPTFLSRVVLRESMAEVERCRRKVSEDDSDVNMANLVAAEKSVAWLSLEISKAESLKHTSKSTRQPLGVDISVLENQGLSPMSGSNSKRFGR